jgi:hypothetical protein
VGALPTGCTNFIIIGNERKKLKAQGEYGYMPIGVKNQANVY